MGGGVSKTAKEEWMNDATPAKKREARRDRRVRRRRSIHGTVRLWTCGRPLHVRARRLSSASEYKSERRRKIRSSSSNTHLSMPLLCLLSFFFVRIHHNQRTCKKKKYLTVRRIKEESMCVLAWLSSINQSPPESPPPQNCTFRFFLILSLARQPSFYIHRQTDTRR